MLLWLLKGLLGDIILYGFSEIILYAPMKLIGLDRVKENLKNNNNKYGGQEL